MYNHVNSIFTKIVNEAQKHQTSKNHESSFFLNKTSRYMYDLSKTNNMHTYPKHKRVHNEICMKASDSRV